MMLRKSALPLLLVLFSAVRSYGQSVSETRYDWSKIAAQITENSTDKYEQAYKIYRWLCENIAYDTTYSIHTADEAIDKRRGVCQAYSELFYRLGEPLGLKVDIIAGKSKDLHGHVSEMGHAWVFVYTSERVGILVDPTWGAGSVNGRIFTRNDHDDSWFHVDPRWMIFTHFPDEAVYQLLPDKIDYATFRSLPSYRPALEQFGQDAQRLLDLCLSGRRPSIPDYYPQLLARVRIGSLPTDRVLHVGRYYTFALEPKQRADLMLHNGTDYLRSDEWELRDGFLVCRYMPAAGGPLSVSVRDADGTWNVIAEYEVAAPSAEEIARLEAAEPHRSPALARVENFYTERWMLHGVSIADLLSRVKAGGIGQLPLLDDRVKYDIDEIPWNGILSVGRTYTFRISPREGIAWAVVNGTDWYRDWSADPATGRMEISVTPVHPGHLSVCAQLQENDSYLGCIEYVVE